jgi:hypothetical protein
VSPKSFSLSTVIHFRAGAFAAALSSVLGAAALIATLNACSSDPKKERDDMKGTAGTPPPLMVDNIGSGGMAGSAGSAGSTVTTSASGSGGSTAGSGGSAGSAGTAGSAAGSGGSSAGSGGSAGSSSAGSSADAGMPEEDPIGDLLGGAGQTSCEGLICLEAADCADLYPDENATCKFTDCVDFMCK